MKRLKLNQHYIESVLYKKLVIEFMEKKFLDQGELSDAYYRNSLKLEMFTGHDKKDIFEFGLEYINKNIMKEIEAMLKFFIDMNINDVKEWSIDLGGEDRERYIQFTLPLPKNMEFILKEVNYKKFDL